MECNCNCLDILVGCVGIRLYVLYTGVLIWDTWFRTKNGDQAK